MIATPKKIPVNKAFLYILEIKALNIEVSNTIENLAVTSWKVIAAKESTNKKVIKIAASANFSGPKIRPKTKL